MLELIDNLPTACRLNEAVANDPEAAAQLAALPKSSDPWAPRVSEFDLTAHMLRELISKVDQLTQVNVAAAGGKPGTVQPFPAPRTEIDRAIEAADRQWIEDFAGRMGFGPEDI